MSAFKAAVHRPEFERLLNTLRSEEIGGVVVWKLDRLTRQQRDLVRVMEACEAQKAFIASATEPIDTREPHGQFVAELLVAQARMESANTSARQTRKAQEQREQGLPPTTGLRCFGYDLRYTKIIEEEASVLREGRDRLFAGDSLRSLALDLEARGIVGTQGHAWRAQILKRLLTSPTIAGMREKEGKLYPGIWPAVISPDDHQRLKVLLDRRNGGPRQSPPRKYLLTGLMTCGRCGGRMSAHARGDASRRYVCQKAAGAANCGKMSIKAEPVEELVAEMVFVAVDDEALRAALAAKGEQDDGLVEAVRRDERALEELARDFYVEKLVSREEFFAARDGLNRRLEGNRVKLAKRERTNVLGRFAGEGGALRTAWESGSLEWRRAIVGAVLDYVTILPGEPGRKAVDPARVSVQWRY